ncbi:MAG: UbiA-like polyprenyltransferase [Anaerolineae bacterium]|nr:putative 4-hydroxybenzoate polyprenyltransferase [Thermoflexus sp.]MDW8064700.1 UbiA-like polyprenyltransferase [Anaerolineae bacterium]
MGQRVKIFLEAIKFQHTIFALPFAYIGMLLAAGGRPSWNQVLWITVAMVAARTLAMSMNRLADREYDARNPRTATRPLPRGLLRPETLKWAVGISSVVLTVAAWALNPLCVALLPGALLFLIGYHYTKRFTWLSHWILGFTDGLAPMGAWIAIRGSFWKLEDLPAWILIAAVTTWIAGFDLIYACQDADFDRREGLHSVPARFGIPLALILARLNHLGMLILLVALGIILQLGWPYWLGVGLVGALLVYEHRLVSPNDLSRVDVAFFDVNAYISVLLFVAVWSGLIWGR